MNPTVYQFDLVVSGLDIEVDEAKLSAFERRVGDMTFASQSGVTRVTVEREADSLGAAIRSAIADVESIQVRGSNGWSRTSMCRRRRSLRVSAGRANRCLS